MYTKFFESYAKKSFSLYSFFTHIYVHTKNWYPSGCRHKELVGHWSRIKVEMRRENRKDEENIAVLFLKPSKISTTTCEDQQTLFYRNKMYEDCCVVTKTLKVRKGRKKSLK